MAVSSSNTSRSRSRKGSSWGQQVLALVGSPMKWKPLSVLLTFAAKIYFKQLIQNSYSYHLVYTIMKLKQTKYLLIAREMKMFSVENINSHGIWPMGMLQVWNENGLGRTLSNQSNSWLLWNLIIISPYFNASHDILMPTKFGAIPQLVCHACVLIYITCRSIIITCCFVNQDVCGAKQSILNASHGCFFNGLWLNWTFFFLGCQARSMPSSGNEIHRPTVFVFHHVLDEK